MRRLLIVVVVAAAGCGGEGGSGGDRLTEQEFRAQANQICTDFAEELDALGEPGSLEELGTQLEEGRTIFENGLEELRQLRPPEELQSEYDRLLGTGDDALAAFESMQQAAEDGDVQEVQRIAEEADQADEEADEIARGLGLDDCATD